jgi:hypothetical protein
VIAERSAQDGRTAAPPCKTLSGDSTSLSNVRGSRLT